MAKTTLKIVTPETVGKVRRKLKLLPKLEPKKLTKSDAIRDLADVIEELRTDKGYSFEAIAEAMKSAGLDVSGRSIQIALAGSGKGGDADGDSSAAEM